MPSGITPNGAERSQNRTSGLGGAVRWKNVSWDRAIGVALILVVARRDVIAISGVLAGSADDEAEAYGEADCDDDHCLPPPLRG